MHLPTLSDPALAVHVVSAYSAGEISEATECHRILLWTCQSSCSVVHCGGAGKTSEACNSPAIKVDLLILLSDPACSAGEIREPMPPIMPNTVVVFFFVFHFPKYLNR